jgi:hypothetical protein
MSDGEVRCRWAELQDLEDMLRRLTLSALKLPSGDERGNSLMLLAGSANNRGDEPSDLALDTALKRIV